MPGEPSQSRARSWASVSREGGPEQGGERDERSCWQRPETGEAEADLVEEGVGGHPIRAPPGRAARPGLSRS